MNQIQVIILAGGLSTRLGGVPKAALLVGEELQRETLLARTLSAAAEVIDSQGAANGEALAAVVAPAQDLQDWLGEAKFPRWARQTQEDPPFSGPAAAIAAGLKVLAPDADYVLILACDMPHSPLVAALLAGAVENCAPDEGVMAVDAGKHQPLAGLYPKAPLQRSVDEAAAAHRLNNASVFSLLASVKNKECAVPPGTTADIDTWEDAQQQGIARA